LDWSFIVYELPLNVTTELPEFLGIDGIEGGLGGKFIRIFA
jgi:hypothetical protein